MSEVDWIVLARTPLAVALTLMIAVAYPLLGWHRFRRLAARPEPIPRSTRLSLYANVVVSQWSLVIATALVLGAAGSDLAAVGQGVGFVPLRTALVAAALLVGFAVLSRFTLAQLAQASADDLPAHVRRAGRILPRDAVERAGFVPVAITAGVCEEILYRGWLPWALFAWTGSLALGFVGAAIVFGLGHAYQGRSGIVLTGCLALLLGAVTMWTGSLVPGQFLHVAVDLVNGLAVGATLRRLGAAPAAGTPLVDAPAAPSVESGA